MMSLAQVVEATKGRLQGADLTINQVVTDTRTDCSNGLFVALRGENFDGHNFIDQAKQAGAVALLVDQQVDSDLPQVITKKSNQSLLDLSSWWRSQFSIPVIGVTGSVGKTTVKDMLACIFSETGEGIATQGNLNNEVGVPLTLLRLQDHHQYAIIEMGMNHAGEISRLSKAARPTVAIVNNAAAAHLEGLGSVAAVARAKGEIFEGLIDGGVAVINADDQYADVWRKCAKEARQIEFALKVNADFGASYKALSKAVGDSLAIRISAEDSCFDVNINTVGEHNVANALAASTVALAAGVSKDDIRTGLTKFEPAKGRLNVEVLTNQIELIDDTYNANPESMRAAINVIAQYPYSTLIVGDMGELGDTVTQAHQELGNYAQQKSIGQLFACGEFASEVVSQFEGVAQSFEQQSELIEALPALIDAEKHQQGILVKGSRAARMEHVVAAVRKLLSKRSGQTSEVPNAV